MICGNPYIDKEHKPNSETEIMNLGIDQKEEEKKPPSKREVNKLESKIKE